MGFLHYWFEIVLLLAVVAGVVFAVIAYRRLNDLSVRGHDEYSTFACDPDNSRAEFLTTLRRTSNEIESELRAREASMRGLLREADERIATLTELLASSELVVPHHEPGLEAQPRVPQSSDRRYQEPPEDKGRRVAASEAGRDGRSAVHGRIRKLAQEGKRPEEIAKQLGVGTGEVVLVLGLTNRG